MLCIPHAVTLQITILAQRILSTMAAGDANQTKPIQGMHVFILVLCCYTHIACV